MQLEREPCLAGFFCHRMFVSCPQYPTTAQIKLRREEFALGMVQRSKYAAVKDAQIKLRREECAGVMEQTNYKKYNVHYSCIRFMAVLFGMRAVL